MDSTKVAHSKKAYSLPEELTNFITYAVAAVLSFVGLVFFVLKTTDIGALAVFSGAVFGASFVFVFTIGALCHVPMLFHVTALRRIDRCAVAIIVFGAMTPILLIGLPRGTHTDAVWSYALVPVIFAAAAGAAVCNALDAPEQKVAGLILYVVIGWACVVRADRIISLCGTECFWTLFAGCAAMLIGAAVCALERLPARHIIWHFIVISGAALCFASAYGYLL